MPDDHKCSGEVYCALCDQPRPASLEPTRKALEARNEPACRCVWVEDDELGISDKALADLVRNRANAAPAYPTEVLFDAIKHYAHDDAYEIADAVLRALGMPNG